MLAKPRRIKEQVKAVASPRNQIHPCYQTRTPPSGAAFAFEPSVEELWKQEGRPSCRFVKRCLRGALLQVPLDRDHDINTGRDPAAQDRKSTRLNSSHVAI